MFGSCYDAWVSARWKDPRRLLLELCDRVRVDYHALTKSNTLPLIREWVELTGSAPLAPEWNDCLAGRGRLADWLLSIDEPATWPGPQPLDNLLRSAPFPKIHAIGYWYSDAEYRLPMPRASSTRIDRAVKQSVLDHLKRGREWREWMGYSACRVCGRNDEVMGSHDLTDDVWSWPEGLGHYVEHHDTMLPEEFLAHVARGQRRSRRELEILAALDHGGVNLESYERWLAWAADDVPAKDEGAAELPVDGGWTVTSFETRGPYTHEEVRAMIRSGDIKPYHRLWKLGIGPERKVRDMPGFVELCKSIPPERI